MANVLKMFWCICIIHFVLSESVNDKLSKKVPSSTLDTMVSQKVTVNSLDKIKHKPEKLDKVSFVQLDLKKGFSEKLSEKSLPVAHEVEQAKRTLVGEKDSFPTIKGIKNHIKRHFNKEKETVYRAARKFKRTAVKHFYATRRAAQETGKFLKKDMKKNSAVSCNLLYNYIMLFCLPFFLFFR